MSDVPNAKRCDRCQDLFVADFNCDVDVSICGSVIIADCCDCCAEGLLREIRDLLPGLACKPVLTPTSTIEVEGRNVTVDGEPVALEVRTCSKCGIGHWTGTPCPQRPPEET